MATDLVLVVWGAGEGLLLGGPGQVVRGKAGLAEDEDLCVKCVLLCSASLPSEGELASLAGLKLGCAQAGPLPPRLGCSADIVWFRGACGEMVLPSCALGLGQTFLCPLQEKLPGESCPSQRWKTGCCTSRTCCLQPDPPSPLQNRALRWTSACCCSGRLSPVLGRGAGSRVGCPALRCSERTFPPQDAAVGTCSSTLVDEHGTIFKKNPRRVVRPAGESCLGAGGTWVPAWWRGGKLLVPGFSVQVGEAGAASCLREQ